MLKKARLGKGMLPHHKPSLLNCLQRRTGLWLFLRIKNKLHALSPFSFIDNDTGGGV
jgi:hypothetical protein